MENEELQETVGEQEPEPGEDPASSEVEETTPEPKKEDDPPSDGIELPPPKKKTAQDRIDELTKKRREAEREAERLRRQLSEKKTETPKASADGRPKIENFETQEEYEDALFEWRDTQLRSRQVAEKAKADTEAAMTRFEDKAKSIREVYEDFDEVIEAPVFSDVMKDVILKSDEGPLVAYYLGKNQEHALQIASLPANLQIYEIGKLETKLLIAQKTRKATSAPPPISTSGMGGGTAPVDESKLSDDEWYAIEKKRRMERLQKITGG